jgi:hypothetical protein
LLLNGYLFLCQIIKFSINALYRGLFTPSNRRIASRTTCGYLRLIVANTVSTKSMLAHFLSTLNHWFEIIRVFGHLHFRCYTTWSWSCMKFKMSIWSRILRFTLKMSEHCRPKFQMPKIYPDPKFSNSWAFYRVLIFHSGGLFSDLSILLPCVTCGIFSIFRVIVVISDDDSPCGEIFGQIETFPTSKIWYPQNLNLHLQWDPGVELQYKSKIIRSKTQKDFENTNNLSNYN